MNGQRRHAGLLKVCPLISPIDGAYDVTLFEDLGNSQTKLTFIGNEPMESAKNSGQMEGWNQILDKVAAVVTKLAQAK